VCVSLVGEKRLRVGKRKERAGVEGGSEMQRERVRQRGGSFGRRTAHGASSVEANALNVVSDWNGWSISPEVHLGWLL